MPQETDVPDRDAAWARSSDWRHAASRRAVIVVLGLGLGFVLVVLAALVVATTSVGARDMRDQPVGGASASGGGIVANPSRYSIPVSSAAASNRRPLGGSDRIEADPSQVGIAELVGSFPSSYVQVHVYACPDAFTGGSASSYYLGCMDESNPGGVTFGLSVGNGPTTYRTSAPGASAQPVWSPGTGLVSVSDTAPPGIQAPVVFCEQWRGQTLLRSSGDDPPVPVIGQTIRVAFQAGDTVSCNWYRYPGGISPWAKGNISASTYVCTPRPGQDVFAPATGPQPTPDPLTGFPVAPAPDDGSGYNHFLDLQTLEKVCHPSGTPFDFTISGAETGYSGAASVQGGPALWAGLVTDDYTVTESVPSGYGVPYVYCRVGSTGKASSVRRDVTNGSVTIPLGPGRGEYFNSCIWFNVLPTGNPVPPDPADLGTSSITVAAWQCPTDQDFEAAARGGECLDAVTGLTFIMEAGSGGYPSQTDTGDSQAGAVFFGGIDPGLYSVRTPDNQATPIVYCDGVDVPFEDGEILLAVPAHNAFQCDWYIPAGSIPSAETEPGDVDPLSDGDEDGIIDSDEATIYGTDPDDADTDDDGLLDGFELVTSGTDPLVADSDADGLTDGVEVNVSLTNPLDADSDGDGIVDGAEIGNGTDPNDPNDPQPADPLADRDEDGIIDSDESGVYGTDPDDADTDDDGLLDGAELVNYGTNPLVADTDGDGYSDGYEVQIGSDPNSDQEIPTM